MFDVMQGGKRWHITEHLNAVVVVVVFYFID